jgi:hypothetical protein
LATTPKKGTREGSSSSIKTSPHTKKNFEEEESATSRESAKTEKTDGVRESAAEHDEVLRKKKKTIHIKDVRKARFAYNEYVERPSILDQLYSDSLISQSPFRGLFRFILIIGFIYVLNHTLVCHHPTFYSFL